jgi:hypothetical protein
VRIEQIASAKYLIYKMRISTRAHSRRDIGRAPYVRREQHHTRTHNTHPPAYSYGLRIRRHLQMPVFPLAYAAASVPSRAARRALNAPGAHIRGRPGRGVMPRGHNTSVLRAIRLAAFARIRLRTSVIFFIHERSEVGGGKTGDTHTTMVDVG